MPFDENEPYSRSVKANTGDLRPLGDFVLVRPYDEAEQMAAEDRLLAPSPITMTRDGRYLSNRPRGLRYGHVVAIGDGDRIIQVSCEGCGSTAPRLVVQQDAKKWRCSECGSFDVESTGALGRFPLGCDIGDTVIFPRVPANEVTIDNQVYVLCHEEQHILAVVDREERQAT